jgi:hypothetical protein
MVTDEKKHYRINTKQNMETYPQLVFHRVVDQFAIARKQKDRNNKLKHTKMKQLHNTLIKHPPLPAAWLSPCRRSVRNRVKQ